MRCIHGSFPTLKGQQGEQETFIRNQQAVFHTQRLSFFFFSLKLADERANDKEKAQGFPYLETRTCSLDLERQGPLTERVGEYLEN